LFIADLSPGTSATVAGFAPGASVESISRFRALGFVVGTAIEIERRLPFGGPIVVRLGGAAFAIEPDAARQVAISLGSQS